MFFSRALAAAALATPALAFSILAPGGPDVWWVADSENTLIWTCHDNPPATVYQLLLANGNPSILPSNLAILADLNNADCSHTITQQQAALTPATNYTLIIADQLDQTKIYATSQPFEVKAPGSTFPAASATPTDPSQSSAVSATGSATSGSASASASAAASNNNGAANLKLPLAGLLTAVGVVVGLL